MLTQTSRSEHPTFQVLSSPRPLGMDATQRAVDDAIALKIGQLLCSRLCHDLIGPTAAINAGGELMGDDDDHEDNGDVRDLIVDSARQLAGRLTFFRIAFGQSGARSSGLPFAEVRELAEGYLHGSRVQFDWEYEEDKLSGGAMLSGDNTRLLLCLIMLATDALPRGGRLSLRILERAKETLLSITVAGRSIRLSNDVIEALQATEATAVTPRTVHAFYLSCLATRLDASIAFDGAVDGGPADMLEMQVRVPQAAVTAGRLCA
jgi:histidine phosphotransferase ChpT